MRAQVTVCANGRLTLKAESHGATRLFALGDWVDVTPAPEPDAGRFPDEPPPAEDFEPDED